MQADFVEKWSELCKCASKPLTELVELNVNILNNLSKSSSLDDLTQIKKPEDLLAFQAKLANEAIKSAGIYTQKAGEIWRNAAIETSKIVNNIMHETVNKASSGADIFKQAANEASENIKENIKASNKSREL